LQKVVRFNPVFSQLRAAARGRKATPGKRRTADAAPQIGEFGADFAKPGWRPVREGACPEITKPFQRQRGAGRPERVPTVVNAARTGAPREESLHFVRVRANMAWSSARLAFESAWRKRPPRKGAWIRLPGVLRPGCPPHNVRGPVTAIRT